MYIPKIGDSVAARRKIESKIYKNLIVGPVIDTWDNACRIVTSTTTDWNLHFSDWNFQYLHKTDQAQNDQEIKEKDPEGYARMIRTRRLIDGTD